MVKNIKIEPLNELELAFIQQKLDVEYKSFRFGMKWVAIICFLIPLITTFLSSFDPPEKKTNLLFVFIVAEAICIVLFLIVLLATYIHFVFFLKQDLKHKQKLIELTEIVQKKFMPQNQTYHFYINSPTKLSIEVSASDFNKFNEMDEINIEYAQYSKEYFGYF